MSLVDGEPENIARTSRKTKFEFSQGMPAPLTNTSEASMSLVDGEPENSASRKAKFELSQGSGALNEYGMPTNRINIT